MRKKFSTYYHVLPHTTTYYHVLQQNVVFASRTANLACRPSYSTFLLCYYFTPDTVLPRPMFGVGRPRCKKVFHVLPRTTAERNFCISDGQPCMSALVLLFYYFTISLQIQFCRGRCLGLARDAKKFSTYYHVVGRPRCKTLRPMFAVGRPKKLCGRCLRLGVRDAKNSAADVCGWLSEMQKTLWPMFAVDCPRCRDAKKRFCISDGQPCMSALLFYCFTNLLFFYFVPDTVLPRPMFGLTTRDAKKFSTYYSRT